MTDNEDSPDNAEVPESSAEIRRPQRIKPMRPVPSERLGMDTHLTVIKAGVLASRAGAEAVSTERIEQSPEVRKQAASLIMGFLVDFGVFQKEGRNYRPTDIGVGFVRLFQLDENRAKAVLRPLVEKTWWGQSTKTLLEFTPSLAEDSLVKELMIESGVFDSKKERAIRVLVDWMDYTGYIERREGTIKFPPGGASIAAPSQSTPSAVTATAPVHTALPVSESAKPMALSPVPHMPAVGQAPGTAPTPSVPHLPTGWVTLNWPNSFHVQINPTAKALRVLRAAIAQLEAAIEADAEESAGDDKEG